MARIEKQRVRDEFKICAVLVLQVGRNPNYGGYSEGESSLSAIVVVVQRSVPPESVSHKTSSHVLSVLNSFYFSLLIRS